MKQILVLTALLALSSSAFGQCATGACANPGFAQQMPLYRPTWRVEIVPMQGQIQLQVQAQAPAKGAPIRFVGRVLTAPFRLILGACR